MTMGTQATIYGVISTLEKYEVEEAKKILFRMVQDLEHAALRSEPDHGVPVAWRYRWTNPYNEPNRERDMRWEPVEPKYAGQTMQGRIEELLSYESEGRPQYEVQALYAAPPQQLDALYSAGDAMRRSLLGAIPVGPLDKWELDAFNALSDWDAAKAAAPRPHREPSVEKKEPTCLYCDAPVAQQGQQCSACADDDGDHFGVAGK